ncbi:hypothetical protein Q9Q99_13550 [Curtobacterium flaccumfaciens]|nr:hypothetical protein Q9Q99_13550 [Curtobacterium flaccumfaciens]
MTADGRRAVLAGIRAHTGALEDLFWRPVGTDAETLRSVSARSRTPSAPTTLRTRPTPARA